MRNDELDAAWRLVTPVLDGWANSTVPPAPYAAGSWGPDAADRLLGPVGRRWRTP
jgi:glucose-6-phosphate 1-dehydrogenase